MQTQDCPTILGLPYTYLSGRWHIQGQGLPTVIVAGAEEHPNLWESVLSQWSQHYQILLQSSTAITADPSLQLQGMLDQFGNMQEPLYIIGLHQEASLVCQLAAQLPQLSGLVLLNDQRHGSNWSSTVPGSDTLQAVRCYLPQHIPVLTIWLKEPDSPDPTGGVLSKEHTQHEWMVLPASSSAHTVTQLIHSWMQSHR